MAGIDHQTIYKVTSGKLGLSEEMVLKLAPVLQLPVSTLQAWADEDRLGEERARALAREILGVSEPPPAAEGPGPLTPSEAAQVAAILAIADQVERQRLLRALSPGTLAKVRGLLLGPPPIPPEQERDPGASRQAAEG